MGSGVGSGVWGCRVALLGPSVRLACPPLPTPLHLGPVYPCWVLRRDVLAVPPFPFPFPFPFPGLDCAAAAYVGGRPCILPARILSCLSWQLRLICRCSLLEIAETLVSPSTDTSSLSARASTPAPSSLQAARAGLPGVHSSGLAFSTSATPASISSRSCCSYQDGTSYSTTADAVCLV